MEIGFLGTGSGYSQGTRLPASLIFINQKSMLMIDCSGFPEQSLQKQGIGINEVNHLFLTHHHPDHIYALPSFIQSRRLASLPGKAPKLCIYGLPETLNYTSKMIGLFGFEKKNPAVEIDHIPLCFNRPVFFEDCTVEPVRADHSPSEALGFIISDNHNNQVLYSGDTRPCPSILNRIEPNTTLIHECSGLTDHSNHSSASQLARELHDKILLRIYLVHLPFLTRKEKEKVLKVLSSNINCPILIPNDSERIIL